MLQKKGRFIASFLSSCLAAGLLYIAFDVLPDPEPNLNASAFALLYSATFALAFGATAAGVLALGAITYSGQRPE